MLNAKLFANVNIHREARDWYDRALANGGIVSKSTLKAVSDFCYRIDAANIRDKFLRLNLFCGSNLDACFTPLYRGPSFTGTKYGNTKETNIGSFIPSDYTETGSGAGLNGNSGSLCYLNTGLDATGFTDMGAAYNNIHGSVYLPSLGTYFAWMGMALNGCVFGFQGGDYGSRNIFFYSNDNAYDAGGGNLVASETCSNQGLIFANLKSGNYKMSINNTNCTTTSRVQETNNCPWTGTYIYVMAGYIGYIYIPEGSGATFPDSYFNSTDDTVAGYSIGIGFSDSEISSYYDAITAFQKVLGRNI